MDFQSKAATLPEEGKLLLDRTTKPDQKCGSLNAWRLALSVSGRTGDLRGAVEKDVLGLREARTAAVSQIGRLFLSCHSLQLRSHFGPLDVQAASALNPMFPPTRFPSFASRQTSAFLAEQ